MPHGSLDSYHEKHHRFRKEVMKALIINKILRDISNIYVASDHERGLLPEYLQNKTKVVGLGISDKSQFITKTNFNEKYFICMGRITAKKRLDLAIRAFAIFSQNNPGYRLKIAGNGDAKLKKSLITLSLSLGITSKIDFLGWVTGQAKEDLLASASALLLPSDDENFAVIVGEALLRGTPCIVTRMVALSSVVDKFHLGSVLNSQNIQEISSSMEKAIEMNTPEFREKAREIALHELNWNVAGEKWRDAIINIPR
jgi:glycosyltransferase involved in cell wall biosynthesis